MIYQYRNFSLYFIPEESATGQLIREIEGLCASYNWELHRWVRADGRTRTLITYGIVPVEHPKPATPNDLEITVKHTVFSPRFSEDGKTPRSQLYKTLALLKDRIEEYVAQPALI